MNYIYLHQLNEKPENIKAIDIIENDAIGKKIYVIQIKFFDGSNLKFREYFVKHRAEYALKKIKDELKLYLKEHKLRIHLKSELKKSFSSKIVLGFLSVGLFINYYIFSKIKKFIYIPAYFIYLLMTTLNSFSVRTHYAVIILNSIIFIMFIFPAFVIITNKLEKHGKIKTFTNKYYKISSICGLIVSIIFTILMFYYKDVFSFNQFDKGFIIIRGFVVLFFWAFTSRIGYKYYEVLYV